MIPIALIFLVPCLLTVDATRYNTTGDTYTVNQCDGDGSCIVRGSQTTVRSAQEFGFGISVYNAWHNFDVSSHSGAVNTATFNQVLDAADCTPFNGGHDCNGNYHAVYYNLSFIFDPATLSGCPNAICVKPGSMTFTAVGQVQSGLLTVDVKPVVVAALAESGTFSLETVFVNGTAGFTITTHQPKGGSVFWALGSGHQAGYLEIN